MNTHSVRILHAADFHLDSRFEGLTDKQAAQRRREQRDIMAKIIEIALERKVQALLFAGDLFDSDSPFLETSDMLRGLLGQLNLPVFIAPGNHDYYSKFSPYARISWPENVHIFTSREIQCVPLPELGLKLWGAAFTDRTSPPLLKGFRAAKEGHHINILLLHGDTGSKDSPYNPVSREEIEASGLDYLALGHQHKFSGPRKAGGSFYAWPGCTEGRGFDELGEKGIILADISPGGCEIDFVPLGGRKYEILPVDVSDCADSQDMICHVLSQIPPDSRDDIYRILLRGEADPAPDTGQIGEGLEGRFFALQIRDETQLRRDIWEKSGEDTLRGLFISNIRGRYQAAASDQEREILLSAARWGLRALDNAEEIL